MRRSFRLQSALYVVLIVGLAAVIIWGDPDVYNRLFVPIIMPQHTAEELWNNPFPTPQVISTLSTTYGSSHQGDGRWLCAGILIYRLWEPTSRGVEDAIMKSTGITVDGQRILPSKMSFFQFTTIIFRYDEQRNEIGSHGGDMEICFEPPPLSPGLHVATIRFESNADTPYSHEWAFNVP